MAVMIPERIPSDASQGEKNTFALLQKLPDDCICYYEPVVGERYPDFVVIVPELGVLIIEVKGWYQSSILKADTRDVTVNWKGRTETHTHPVRQARDYMLELMDACKASRHARHLLNHGGRYDGRFIFPFGHVAFMSNITRSQLDMFNQDLARDVFGEGKVVMRDEMEDLLALPSAELLDAMRGWFSLSWQFPQLTKEQVDSIRLIIHPEIVIEGTSLAVLDHQQEARARSIGDGHRLIYGVAGSGKTVMLIARAKLLAKQGRKKVLMLCFNKPLAERLGELLADYPYVDALHFHRWAGRNGALPVGEKPDWNEEVVGNALLQRLQAGAGDAARYDAVFIDEAQDFHPTWFTCAKYALKDPENGDLLIALDGGQNLYGRQTFTWKSVGVHAKGRVVSRNAYDFDRNYRNTRQILTVAAPFAAVNESPDEDDALQSHQVNPGFAVREGPHPKVFAAKNRDEEIRKIADGVQTWVQKGVYIGAGQYEPLHADEIAVLYPRNPKFMQADLDRLSAALRRVAPVRHVSSGTLPKGVREDPPASITLGTIHSSKGLQFKAVVIVWADLFAHGADNPQRIKDRALLYVGITRAYAHLRVTSSRETPVTREIALAIDSLDRD